MLTPERIAERKKGIGGSDAAAVAGLNPFCSAITVWLNKTGQLPDKEENEKMHFGSKLEDLLADEFMERSGKKLFRVNEMLIHPEYTFMLANIDRRVVGEKAGWEGKCTSYRDVEKEIPDYWFLQVQHYLLVTGWERWYLSVLVNGNHYFDKVIEPDIEVMKYLVKIESDFWKLVESGTPPEPDGSDDCSRMMLDKYPQSNGQSIILPINSETTIKEYMRVDSEIRALEKEKAEYQNRLKGILGENEYGVSQNHRVTWKSYVQERFDTDRFKKEMSDIYGQYKEQIVVRKFEIKELDK